MKSRKLQCFALVVVCILLNACLSKEPIRIGVVAPLTRFSTELGTQGRDGAILAAEEINAQGGIHGHLIELVIRDVGGGPDSCKIILKEMQNQGIQYFVGPYTSNMAKPAMDVMDSSHSLMITTTISSDILAGRNDQILRISSSGSKQVHGIVQNIISRGFKTAAIVYDVNNREYAQALVPLFNTAFTQMGGSIVYTDSIVNDSRPPLTTAASLAKVKADAFYIITTGNNLATIVQSLRINGQQAPVFGASWGMTPELLLQGGKAIEGLTFNTSTPPVGSFPNGKAFEENFNHHYGKTAAFSAVLSYEAVHALATGFTLAGSSTPSFVKDSLLAQSTIHGVYNDFHWDKYGDIIRQQVMVQVHNGNFVVIQNP